MIASTIELAEFGWHADFSAQLDDDETALPVRVMAVHRDRLHVAGPGLDTHVQPYMGDAADPISTATVGDWLLLEPETLKPVRLLQRRSLIKRRAAGTGRQVQLIAANVDTLLIVTSCNLDFNVARLERYLALAREADVQPIIVLSKADLHAQPNDLARDLSEALAGVLVEVVDARDAESVAGLRAWCGMGRTVAVAGSSGVGKSTLINTLTGAALIATSDIRARDDKGRHTTSGRALHRLPDGGWLLDTPGMRELQLTDAADGIDDVFADVAQLTEACRFRDCRHETEPGCAITAALASGSLDPDRFARWRKLRAEEVHNSASLAQRRAQDRTFGRMTRPILTDKKSR